MSKQTAKWFGLFCHRLKDAADVILSDHLKF